MSKAKERYEDNMKHAGDAGSLWEEQNTLVAIQQYEIERIFEECGYEPTDDNSIEDDVELIIEWIRAHKGEA